MGTPLQPHGQAVQRYLPGADAEHHAPRLPPYLLQQHGEVGHESQDAPIPDGTQRHWGDVKYLHPPWAGGCHGRAAPDGGLGERQKGTGKEQGRETRLTEDVPGDLNKESFCALLRQGIFLFLLYPNGQIYAKIPRE